MPLFSLSWNIIGIGFILAMNFFAVDYALHLLGFSKFNKAKVETIQTTRNQSEVSAVRFIDLKRSIKSLAKTQSPPFQRCFCFQIYLNKPTHKGDRSIAQLLDPFRFSLSRRGPPNNG